MKLKELRRGQQTSQCRSRRIRDFILSSKACPIFSPGCSHGFAARKQFSRVLPKLASSLSLLSDHLPCLASFLHQPNLFASLGGMPADFFCVAFFLVRSPVQKAQRKARRFINATTTSATRRTIISNSSKPRSSMTSGIVVTGAPKEKFVIICVATIKRIGFEVCVKRISIKRKRRGSIFWQILSKIIPENKAFY